MKVVIVGGVAGGASAAARLRRLNEKAEIIVFEKSGYVSYANCGLPYYIGGVITDKSELTLQTPESFWQRFHIDVRVKHQVTSINREKKTVTVKNLVNGCEFEESYDKLILSTGAKPAIPKLENIESDKIFTLRTVEDTFKIYDFADSSNTKTATVIGGGFIGLETAENLAHRGIKVTLVEYADHVLAPFDFDMACQLHNVLRKNGITLMLKTGVTGFEEKKGKIISKTSNGGCIESDMVLLAIGVVPDTELAQKAELELGIKNSVVVNDNMQTSDEDIYAVGDAVEVKHYVTGKKALIALAGPANKQGRIAADNICGVKSTYKGSQGSSVMKLFDLTAASTGVNESLAKVLGIKYNKVVLTPLSHASYYPDAQPMTLKLIYEEETLVILGAQIVGYDGVDKRIDVIATAIRAGLKATDLCDLDLAYAPPYSSAKDPVNMAGFMVENIVTNKVKQFHYEDLENVANDSNAFLLDTRTPYEYRYGHADGFANIPVDDLRDRINEIPKDKKIYVMCQSGLRSYIACRILSQYGYDCYNFSGGYGFYETIEKGKMQNKNIYPCGIEK